MSKARIDDMEKALIAYLAGAAQATAGKWQVAGLSAKSVDAELSIILRAPAVLVFYSGENGRYTPIGRAAAAGGTRYDVWERFTLFAVCQSLRSEDEQRLLAYSMLEDLKTLCAGAKLALASGVESYLWLAGPPAWVGRAAAGGVVYALEIEVHGTWDNV